MEGLVREEHGQRFVYRICMADDLERLTGEGWEFIQTIREEYSQATLEEVPFFIPYANGNGYFQNQSVTKHLPHSKTLFLLRRDQDSVIKNLVEQNKKTEESLKACEESAINLVNKIGALNVQIDDQNMRLERLSKEDHRLRSELNSERDRTRKFEKDIAKIRTAIGEREMRVILEEEDKDHA